MSIYNDKIFVYWIHHPKHTDVQKDGYVGVTNDPNRRFREHKRSKTTIIGKAFIKYGDVLICEVLAEASGYEEAKEIERILRPKSGIGWNLVEGGGLPPNRKGKPLSEEHKKKVSESKRKENLSLETRRLLRESNGKRKHSNETRKKISKARSGIYVGENSSRFRGWYTDHMGNKYASHKEASEKMGTSIDTTRRLWADENIYKPITKMEVSRNPLIQRIQEDLGYDIEGMSPLILGFSINS